MSDVSRELVELKKEVIEARNQGIKTDNLMKNVSLDVKGFEKRFEVLERRTRIAGLGAHVIVALVIVAAATVVSLARSQAQNERIRDLSKESESAQVAATKEIKVLTERLRLKEAEYDRRQKASLLADRITTLLENKKDREASDLVLELELAELSLLERRLLEKKLSDLRRRAGEAAYRAGRAQLTAKRYESAIKELSRCLQLDPDGRYSDPARYLQATTLHDLKRYDQAEPLLRTLKAKTNDKNLQDEVRFYLATALARQDKRVEAKALFKSAAMGGRYQNSARLYLAAIESGSPLPDDSSKKRRHTVATTTATP